jgi:thiosulfate/3-mercaptopyruvate sulfurtransferase
LSKGQFEQTCSKLGIANDTTVVFYGDKSNWFACYALWLFQYYGHENVRIMNGGRAKWELEKRPFVKEVPTYPPTRYAAKLANANIRAFREDVFAHLENRGPLVDVRSPKEYTGELLHMPNYPQEGATRGGHIPGAVSIPWSQAVNEADSTFKSPEELRALYEGKGVKPDEEVIAYCRIGERSSLTWFVLKYLLGYPKVRNYDGSWTEWGNLVDAPIEK